MNTSAYRDSAIDKALPVLILGGSGFIGTRLARLLTQREIPVRIGDIRKSEEFPELWSQCDVRDQKTLFQAMRGSGVVINLAAEHRDDVRPISRYRETNVKGASEVCSAAQLSGIRRLIFTSSVAVYGFHSKPIDESGSCSPFNAYGETKLEAEAVYRRWAAEDPARALIIVRPTVVFGEENRGNVYNLMKQIASRRFLMVGSGRNVKSISYVGNVAAFLAHILSLGPGTHVFNYADGPDMNTNDLVSYIKARMGNSSTTPSIPLPIALTAGYGLDVLSKISGRTFPISAIRVQKFCENTQFLSIKAREIGFVQPYTLADALTRTIQAEFPGSVGSEQ